MGLGSRYSRPQYRNLAGCTYTVYWRQKIIDPQVITDLPLPDTSSANITVRTGVSNTSDKEEKVTVTGKIENIEFSKQIDMKPGEKTNIVFSPEEFPQLKFKNPRLWWPNNYGRPELYFLDLYVTAPGNIESDHKQVRFGIRELSYELTVDAPGKELWRVEFNPTFALKESECFLFDNIHRRDIGDGVSIPRLRDGIDTSLLKDCPDQATAPYLVIKVNGRQSFCRGGNWGMDDAMKNTTREHLEPSFRLHRDEHFNMIPGNWTGESTEETFLTFAINMEFWFGTISGSLFKVIT